ncbi:hypothetical protein QTP86_004154, partial [Hemibagrus guttatus]
MYTFLAVDTQLFLGNKELFESHGVHVRSAQWDHHHCVPQVVMILL